MTEPHTRLSNEESAAFDRWRSTPVDTPERAKAWDEYCKALDKLTRATAVPRKKLAKAA